MTKIINNNNDNNSNNNNNDNGQETEIGIKTTLWVFQTTN